MSKEALMKAAQATNADLHAKVYVPTFVQAFNKYAEERGLSKIASQEDLETADRVLTAMKKEAQAAGAGQAKVSDFAKIAGVKAAAAPTKSFESELIAHFAKSASADQQVLNSFVDLELARQAAVKA